MPPGLGEPGTAAVANLIPEPTPEQVTPRQPAPIARQSALATVAESKTSWWTCRARGVHVGGGREYAAAWEPKL